MSNRQQIVAAGNTYNPCLVILRSRGYGVGITDAGERSIWTAEKEGWRFSAYSPPELLGIVTLWENFGDDWNRQHPDVLGELFSS